MRYDSAHNNRRQRSLHALSLAAHWIKLSQTQHDRNAYAGGSFRGWLTFLLQHFLAPWDHTLNG